MYVCTVVRIQRSSNRHTDRDKHRHTDRQADRQTDKQNRKRQIEI